MRIIDEKGRLFGKINVIDFLVILFLLCLTPMFYFGYKILNKPVEVKKIEGISVSVDIYTIFKNLSPDVAKLISVGDKELDSDGNVIGEILDVGKVESNFIDIKLSETYAVTKEDAQRRQVTAKLRIIGRLDGSDILYKENRVKIGSEINFETAEYVAEGIIIPEPSQVMQIYKPGFNLVSLIVLFKNISPEVANLISVGDFEVDKDGDTIAKVLNVGTIEPYAYRIDLGGGNYITKTDPQKRQVQTKMEIMGGVEGNAFYFRDKRIALDSEVEFNTNKYRIEGVVIQEPTAVKKIDKKWLWLKVRFTNLMPELAGLIKEGDEERWAPGDLVARVESIIGIEPSEEVIQDNRELIVTKHPLNKDVVLLIKTSCIATQKGLLFKETGIKIGNTISLQTDKYDIIGKIIEIKEVND